MCGRFSLWLTLSDLKEAWPDFIFPEALSPRYNIAPSQDVAVVTNNGGGKVEFLLRPYRKSFAPGSDDYQGITEQIGASVRLDQTFLDKVIHPPLVGGEEKVCRGACLDLPCQ